MSDALSLVQEFCDLMVQRNPALMRPFFDDAIVYQNVGMEATVGIEAVAENLAGQFAMFPNSYEYETCSIAANGDVVLTERIDYITAPDGTRHGLPVMGAFVVRDGRIVRWTDYWDTGILMKMMTGEDVSALVPASY